MLLTNVGASFERQPTKSPSISSDLLISCELLHWTRYVLLFRLFMLFNHDILGLPLPRLPSTIPYRIVLATPLEWLMWPDKVMFCHLIVARRCSWGEGGRNEQLYYLTPYGVIVSVGCLGNACVVLRTSCLNCSLRIILKYLTHTQTGEKRGAKEEYSREESINN